MSRTICLLQYYTPSAISEAYKLSQINQETSETVMFYISRIKMSASKCDFGAAYDRMVRDKFICGLRNEKLRAILMNDDQITTSAQALARAISRENSDAAAHVMNVNTVQYKQYGHKKRFNNNSRNNSANRSSKPDGASNSGGSVRTKCTLKGHVAENCYTKCR